MEVEESKVMNMEQFTTGENSHLEAEKWRRIVMIAGLTKDQSDLRNTLLDDAES